MSNWFLIKSDGSDIYIACLAAKSNKVALKICCQSVLFYSAPTKSQSEKELWVTEFSPLLIQTAISLPINKSSFIFLKKKNSLIIVFLELLFYHMILILLQLLVFGLGFCCVSPRVFWLWHGGFCVFFWWFGFLGGFGGWRVFLVKSKSCNWIPISAHYKVFCILAVSHW